MLGPDLPAPPARALVVIPTYNELESLAAAVRSVLDLGADLDVLIVDDGSPDGTGHLADRLAADEPRVSVLHRSSKDGLGRAYLAGFERAMAQGYPAIVEFDADGSHPASSLPGMLDVLKGSPAVGVVIGSRWVPGGSVVDWSPFRTALSRGGNAYARVLLGIPIRDSTAGFRAYSASALRAMTLEDIHSRGYCFQIDMTLRVLDARYGIVEVPIEFRERAAGTSKMSRAIVAEAVLMVPLWGIQRRVRRLGSRGAR